MRCRPLRKRARGGLGRSLKLLPKSRPEIQLHPKGGNSSTVRRTHQPMRIRPPLSGRKTSIKARKQLDSPRGLPQVFRRKSPVLLKSGNTLAAPKSRRPNRSLLEKEERTRLDEAVSSNATSEESPPPKKRKPSHDSDHSSAKKPRELEQEASVVSDDSDETHVSKKEKKKQKREKKQKRAIQSDSVSGLISPSSSTSEGHASQAKSKDILDGPRRFESPSNHSPTPGPSEQHDSRSISSVPEAHILGPPTFKDPGRCRLADSTHQRSGKDGRDYVSASRVEDSRETRSTPLRPHHVQAESSRARAQSAPASALGRRSTPSADSQYHLPQIRRQAQDEPRLDGASDTRNTSKNKSFGKTQETVTSTPTLSGLRRPPAVPFASNNFTPINDFSKSTARGPAPEFSKDRSAVLAAENLEAPGAPKSGKDNKGKVKPYSTRIEHRAANTIATISRTVYSAPERQQHQREEPTHKPRVAEPSARRQANETRRHGSDMVPVSCACGELPYAL